MKMIIVLDKVCLLGVICISVYAGYNLRKKEEKFRYEVRKNAAYTKAQWESDIKD